jgi:hypothetical protein
LQYSCCSLSLINLHFSTRNPDLRKGSSSCHMLFSNIGRDAKPLPYPRTPS